MLASSAALVLTLALSALLLQSNQHNETTEAYASVIFFVYKCERVW